MGVNETSPISNYGVKKQTGTRVLREDTRANTVSTGTRQPVGLGNKCQQVKGVSRKNVDGSSKWEQEGRRNRELIVNWVKPRGPNRLDLHYITKKKLSYGKTFKPTIYTSQTVNQVTGRKITRADLLDEIQEFSKCSIIA